MHQDKFRITLCHNNLTQEEWDGIFKKGGQGQAETAKPLTTASPAESAGKDKQVGDTPIQTICQKTNG